ncbi:MAG: hypothetical protein LBS74_02260 [Oscillospiraceae bacterium]|nr:hypothetical protein [Oscillospiraceae bacterium]
MFKKLFIILTLACLVFSLVSCKAIPQTQPEETSSLNSSVSSDESIVPTSSVDIAAISAQLAQLSNEDGTGEIYLSMPISEIETKLDTLEFSYEKDMELSLMVIDGTLYAGSSSGDSPHLDWFWLQQTKSGLKIGDPKERITEIYGAPNQELSHSYVYYKDRPGERPVDFMVSYENGCVSRI